MSTSAEQLGQAASLGDVSPRPWRRYLARMLDYLWGQYAVAILLGITAPGFVADLVAIDNQLVWGMVALAGFLNIEALLLSIFGTTPAKALLGLRVVTNTGRPLTFGLALRRSLNVWVRGMAIGFPIISLFAMARAKARLDTDRVAPWDRDLGTVVRYSRAAEQSVVGA